MPDVFSPVDSDFRLYMALLGRGQVRIDTALRTAKPPS
jgi:hypothetical protein